MSDIEELNSRIMAAMDRVAQGVEAISQADTGEAEALARALEEEKEVNAQLSERVRVLGERQEQAVAAMEAKTQAATERLTALDTELQQLRKANGMLTEACEALREANAAGVGEPHLINQSMMAELESIRAMRSAEMAEAQEIITALTPLLNTGSGSLEEEEAG
ncbi:hypothetical protein [Roseobacter weihaiensis]|uniref:hypothetical protein n=1 Tax=Roseobacter weihaiensis TaxID=2763262 RepID=UPI001D0B8FFB|nr:hypothetical protein [Roseobacter sp. H9]